MSNPTVSNADDGSSGEKSQNINTRTRIQELQSYQEAEQLVRSFAELHTVVTVYPSLLKSFEMDSIRYMLEILDVKNRRGRRNGEIIAAVIRRCIHEKLQRAGPIVFQTWLLSKKVQEKLHTFFKTICKAMPRSDYPSDEELTLYADEVKKFREYMKAEFDHPEAKTVDGSAVLKLGSHGCNYLTMLESLKAHRQAFAGDEDFEPVIWGRVNNSTFEYFSREHAYQSGKSSIDPLFLTFYHVYKILNLQVNDIYDFQEVIYGLGCEPRGKVSVEKYLRGYTNIKGITGLMSHTTDPGDFMEFQYAPWKMTYHRLYDVVAAIGGVKASDLSLSVKTPGCSWKYFLGFNRRDVTMMTFLHQLYIIECEPYEVNQEFPFCHRMLEQVLASNANSPLACTNFISGNLGPVELIE